MGGHPPGGSVYNNARLKDNHSSVDIIQIELISSLITIDLFICSVVWHLYLADFKIILLSANQFYNYEEHLTIYLFTNFCECYFAGYNDNGPPQDHP